MSSIVLELQQEVLKPDCNILNALRKAHVIAVKLNLTEFDTWIMHELNGYRQNEEVQIPEYRQVQGRLKAFNPYRGWIPVQFNDDKIEQAICGSKMWQSLGELQELYKQCKNGTFQLQFTAETMVMLLKMFSAPQMQYALFVGVQSLKAIEEAVKNQLLEWTLNLEAEGILGENMQFSQEEKNMAQNVPQQFNYYAPVINGDVKQSQVVSGDHNTISFHYEQAEELLEKVKDAIKSEQLSAEDRETAEELIEDAETKIVAKKKAGIVRAALTGLKEFLIGASANVAGALIMQYLQQGII